jgi:putative oxidoreductase
VEVDEVGTSREKTMVGVGVGLLLLRAVVGGLMAGHGAQKLFGSFSGPGLEGTGGFLESLDLRPGKRWAWLAGLSEFGGGVLTVLGFLNPLGPLGIIGSMAMATTKVHWNKPIWVTSGGAELPVINIAAATAIMIAGPGDLSLDEALGTKLPAWVAPVGLVGVAATAAYGMTQGGVASPEPSQEEAAGGELSGGETAHPV